jgi:hypothetical protein
MHQIPDDHAIHHVFKTGRLTYWLSGAFASPELALVRAAHIRARWLLQRELVVGQRFIDLQFDHVQGKVVTLPRPFDLDRTRKCNPRVVFVILVMRVGRDVSMLVVNPLLVREQVDSAELDLAR